MDSLPTKLSGKPLYNIESFTFSPIVVCISHTAWLVMGPETTGVKVTPELGWGPAKPHPWETTHCQMGGEESAAVLHP